MPFIPQPGGFSRAGSFRSVIFAGNSYLMLILMIVFALRRMLAAKQKNARRTA